MKTIFNYLNDYKLILLGALMFSVYIWARFIRGRLPKDIPFSPSILGFFLLIEICLIYTYIVYTVMRPPREPNKTIDVEATRELNKNKEMNEAIRMMEKFNQ